MPQMYCSLVHLLYSPYPPACLDVRTFAIRYLHVHNDTRDPSSERWNLVGKKVPVILPKWRLPHHLGIFYMPQIYVMGPTALPPLRRGWGFFRPEKPWWLRLVLNPRTRVLKGSTLPLDHRNRYTELSLYCYFLQIKFLIIKPTGCTNFSNLFLE